MARGPALLPSGPLIDRLVRDEPQVAFKPDDPYLRSYPEFLAYFRDTPVIQTHHVIIGPASSTRGCRRS